MGNRLAKMRRLVAVQGQLHRLAEWKLASLDREMVAVRRDQEHLLTALNRDEALQGLFIAAMARRLDRLAREADRLGAARAAQTRRLVEEGLRLKRTERLADRARGKAGEEARRRAFDDLLEILAGRGNASFP